MKGMMTQDCEKIDAIIDIKAHKNKEDINGQILLEEYLPKIKTGAKRTKK